MPKLTAGAAGEPETLQSIVEQLGSAEAAAGRGIASGSSSRAAVMTKLWTAMLQSDIKQKEELLKSVPPARLMVMMEGSQLDVKSAYAAAGCLACLVAHPRWLTELTANAAVTNRLIAACLVLLDGEHDRSRLPAVQLLLALAQCPTQVPRLAPALPALLAQLSAAGGPGWAGSRALAAAAAGVLAALLAPSECEVAEQQQARRLACLAAGAVPVLLMLLQSGSGSSLLSAAACLRFMALAPGAADIMAGDVAAAQQLVQLVQMGPGAHPGTAAYISGTIWELAASAAAAEHFLAAGAVPAMLAVIRETAAVAAASSKSKKKKGGKGKKGKGKGNKEEGAAAGAGGKKGDGSGSGRKKGQSGGATAAGSGAGGSSNGGAAGSSSSNPPQAFEVLADPQAAAGVALCNTTGALHHLTFLDAAKQQLGSSADLSLLVGLLSRVSGQTYDNLVGALWNVGLMDVNQPLLAAAGAPPHLVRPIPARWATSASSCRPASAAAAMAAKMPTAPARPLAAGPGWL